MDLSITYPQVSVNLCCCSFDMLTFEEFVEDFVSGKVGLEVLSLFEDEDDGTCDSTVESAGTLQESYTACDANSIGTCCSLCSFKDEDNGTCNSCDANSTSTRCSLCRK
jgi:hypothetical protein